MSEYVLSIAIGPVQDFIAAARRTRDLAYGSTLLSEVSKACARFLIARNGTRLIFPTPIHERDLGAGTPFMAANKILAIVTADGEQAMRDLAGACRVAVREYLAKDVLPGALRKATGTLQQDGISVDAERAREHVQALNEFYAAWAEMGPGDGGYAEAWRKAERRMAARKALRDFAPHEGKAGFLKSSLDGYRETVLTRPGTKSERQYFVRPDEQLDGVGVLKRFGGVRERLTFDSTSDVAAMPYVRSLERNSPAVLKQFRDFLEASSGVIPRSYSYLYSHTSRRIAIPELRRQLEGILHGVPQKPEAPYYALFLGDGDFMGRALGDERYASEKGHRDISRSLSAFAKELSEKFRDEYTDAECVYAGGDDVMALLPLHRALVYSKAIREMFNRHMKPWGVTLSAGLVVAHALEPLDDVRRMAGAAERAAKSIDRDKDALAVVVSPRSGANVQTVLKWDAVASGLENIVGMYVAGRLSKGLGHELRTLLARWEGDTEAMGLLDEALPALAMAIAKKKEYTKEAEGLVAPATTRKALTTLVNNLFVARPFARATQEAEGRA